jgi:hypothetical protein
MDMVFDIVVVSVVDGELKMGVGGGVGGGVGAGVGEGVGAGVGAGVGLGLCPGLWLPMAVPTTADSALNAAAAFEKSRLSIPPHSLY